MLRYIAAFAILTAAVSGTALAEDLPKTADECFKTTISLAKEAEDAKLADSKLATIEALLTKMENHCEAKQFAEAVAVSKDVKATIGSP